MVCFSFLSEYIDVDIVGWENLCGLVEDGRVKVYVVEFVFVS